MHWIHPQISFFRRSVCVSVNRSVIELLLPQFFTDFHEILRATQKCGRFDAYSLWDKPEVVCQFLRCADSDFGSFQALVAIFVNRSAPNLKYRSNSAMPTLYSMPNETGNRNRILEMCKFSIWIRLRITSTILYRFSPNFACSSEMWSHRRLFVTQTERSWLILEVCGFRFRQFSGSGENQISTRSHVPIKFDNADFVFDGEWNRK